MTMFHEDGTPHGSVECQNEDMYSESRRKPKWFGKKRYYKKQVLLLKEQLRRSEIKCENLERKYIEIQSSIENMYQEFGHHYHIYMDGEDIHVGDTNVVYNQCDSEEVLRTLDTLLKRTTHSLKEAIKMQAEGNIKMDSMKEALVTMSRKLAVLEAESSSTFARVDTLNKRSSDICDKVDDLQELAILAQNPEPNEEMVKTTISEILFYLSSNDNSISRSLGLYQLPKLAQKFPKLLALKYGHRHSSDVQRALVGSTRQEPGKLDDRCIIWIAHWLRRRDTDADTDDLTKKMLHLLQVLDQEIITAQEKEIMKNAVMDKDSVSSRGSSRTIIGPHLTLQREILEKIEEGKNENQREIRELKCELKELRLLKDEMLQMKATQSKLIKTIEKNSMVTKSQYENVKGHGDVIVY